MSRSNSSREVTHKSFNEGTAARTRPVSLEDIMSRRKKKLNTEDKERASEIVESSVKDDNGVLPDGDLESKKDSKHTEKGNSKHVEETSSKKEHKHFGSRDKGNRDSDAKTKLKSNDSKSSRDKDSKNEKQSHQRSRANNRSGADYEKESDKKRAKVSIEKDKHENNERKSGKEGKRKLESRVYDKDRSVIDGSFLKKHDSSKLRDAKYSERKDQKDHYSERKDLKKENYLERKGQKLEHSRTHRDEPKAKRRRSRSREYDRERDRSDSMSPKVQRPSYHGRDYEEPLFQSSKDKSRRKYSDAEQYRTSGNAGYGSGHYRRHGSGLGGYSPRKRKTEAAVRTPPPTKRSPERKNSTWDQPPAGTSDGGSGSVFTNLQSLSSKTTELISSTTVAPTAIKSQPVPSVDATSMPINVSIDSVQLTQATRPRRRLYIENVPPSASEKLVIDCLNDFLLSSGVNHIQGAKPCISCIINREKCQAVVEFLTPEDATSAISFDGRSLSGSILKIRRPKDFVEAATGATEKTVPTVKAIPEVVKDSPHKIFIGGISNSLSSDMLLEIVGAFGLLRGYHFEFNEELNGPCAFLEYEDHSITQKACAGLNGMKLGCHVLTAVQAFIDSHGEEDNDEDLPSYDIPSHAKSLLADSTQVLQLKNVFNPEEFQLLSDTELEEILEDIRLECTRFGTVKSINVVRFSSTTEVAPAGSEQQDPHTDSPKIEPAVSSHSSNSKNRDVDVSTLNNVIELQDVRDDTEHTNTNENPVELQDVRDDTEHTNTNENPVEDYERKESAKPSPTDGVSSVLGDPSNLDKGEDVNAEEIPLLVVDITEGMTADVQAHSINGGGKHPADTANSNSCAADDGELVNGNSSNHHTPDVEVFVPGCVLVEFLRKEAACAAAHCLHQRCYDERIVSASYVSHELYISKFPR